MGSSFLTACRRWRRLRHAGRRSPAYECACVCVHARACVHACIRAGWRLGARACAGACVRVNADVRIRMRVRVSVRARARAHERRSRRSALSQRTMVAGALAMPCSNNRTARLAAFKIFRRYTAPCKKDGEAGPTLARTTPPPPAAPRLRLRLASRTSANRLLKLICADGALSGSFAVCLSCPSSIPANQCRFWSPGGQPHTLQRTITG
jgi:hypothetical protein